jgi:hypothetical protein
LTGNLKVTVSTLAVAGVEAQKVSDKIKTRVHREVTDVTIATGTVNDKEEIAGVDGWLI